MPRLSEVMRKFTFFRQTRVYNKKMELSIEHLVIFLLLLVISYLVYKGKNTINNNTIEDHNQITLEQLKDAVKRA